MAVMTRILPSLPVSEAIDRQLGPYNVNLQSGSDALLKIVVFYGTSEETFKLYKITYSVCFYLHVILLYYSGNYWGNYFIVHNFVI